MPEIEARTQIIIKILEEMLLSNKYFINTTYNKEIINNA